MLESLHPTARGRYITTMQMLLDAGTDINKGSEIPLAVLARAGQARLVRLLIDIGAFTKDDYGLRALTSAAGQGWAGVVEMLCNQGVDVTTTGEKEDSLNPVLMA